MAYTKYSLTPANNNAAPPDGAPEGMLPSAVNDTMRDMMAQIRDVGDGIRGGTYTMTAPVITGGSITGVALSGNTLTNPVITGGSINNTPIGASTANTGAFTTLGASGVATFSAGTVSAPAITTTGDTNTGIYFPAADTIGFTEGGVEALRLNSNGQTSTSIAGTASLPSFTRTGDENTGIFFPAADTIAFTEGGVESMRIDASGNVGIGTAVPSAYGKLAVIGGGISTDSGYYNFSGTDTFRQLVAGGISYTGTLTATPIVFQVNNTERMRIDSSGNVMVGVTSSTNKFTAISTDNVNIVRFAGATYGATFASFTTGGGFRIEATDPTGIGSYQPLITSGSIQIFTTNASERMRITSGGNVGIGLTPAANHRLSVAGGSTSSSDFALVVSNSTGNTTLAVRNDGAITTGATTSSPYNLTTGSAANMFVASDGYLFRSTSSLKYKTDVQDATHGLAEVLKLRPVTYKGKNDGNTVFGGLIAEEVDAIGLTEFVQYAEDGSPDALAYGNMVSLLAKAIQEQQKLIENLTTRLNALEKQ
jgi:hypothetical protein